VKQIRAEVSSWAKPIALERQKALQADRDGQGEQEQGNRQ
jgi:hypothetical protein